MKRYLLLVLVVFGLLVFFVLSFADEGSFVENFFSTTYKGTPTSVNWDTGTGTLKLPQGYESYEVPVNYASHNFENDLIRAHGYEFIPQVDGRITTLGRYAMVASYNRVVKLWDQETGELLETGTVQLGTGWRWYTLPTARQVSAGHTYTVSVFTSDDYYWRINNFSHPRTVGHIYIKNTVRGSTGSDTRPSGDDNNYLYGMPDIKFQPYGYLTGKCARSLEVDDTTLLISSATLSVTDTVPANTSITYWMSPNEGADWYTVTPGVKKGFNPPGSVLIWQANLDTSDIDVTPSVDELRIDYISGIVVSTTNWTSLVAGASAVRMGKLIPYVKFDMQTMQGSATWKRFRIDRPLTSPTPAPDGKIEVSLWMENNGNGYRDRGDTLISEGNFTDGTVWLNTGDHQVTTASKTYYIVYAFGQGIGGGQSAGVKIADSNYFEFENAIMLPIP